MVVDTRAIMVRRETVRSCDFAMSMRLGSLRRGGGGNIAYEDEGPGDIVFLYMEVMDEEDENAGDDDGGEYLAQS